MAKIEWIKLSVDLFLDEKISRLEDMKNGKEIVLIWIRLLLLAGKQNNGGVFRDFTEGMFASLLSQQKPLIHKALGTFEEHGMIQRTGNDYSIVNWSKYQSEDRMAQIREKDRERKKEKFHGKFHGNSTENSMEIPRNEHGKSMENSTGNALFENKEIENKENTLLTESTKESSPAQKKYGEFEMVLLTDEEHQTLVSKIGIANTKEYIRRLDGWLAEGNTKKNHYVTILKWFREDHPDDKQSSYDLRVIDELIG